MKADIVPGQVIKCYACGRHLASFAMRARCVFECGAWLCRRGGCKSGHLPECEKYHEIGEEVRASRPQGVT